MAVLKSSATLGAPRQAVRISLSARPAAGVGMLEFGGRGPRLPELRRQFGRLDRHGVAFRLSRRELDFESGQPVPKLIGAGSLGIPARPDSARSARPT